VVKFNKSRLVSAAVGVSAVVALGALTAGVTHAAASPAVPQHYGGTVNTTVYAPTASLGMPLTSVASPAPDGAAAATGTAGTAGGLTSPHL
jgi:hypothetical protein